MAACDSDRSQNEKPPRRAGAGSIAEPRDKTVRTLSRSGVGGQAPRRAARRGEIPVQWRWRRSALQRFQAATPRRSPCRPRPHSRDFARSEMAPPRPDVAAERSAREVHLDDYRSIRERRDLHHLTCKQTPVLEVGPSPTNVTAALPTVFGPLRELDSVQEMAERLGTLVNQQQALRLVAHATSRHSQVQWMGPPIGLSPAGIRTLEDVGSFAHATKPPIVRPPDE
jgi:hypothetical protein